MRSSKLNVVAARFGKFLVMALLVLPLLPVVGLQGCAATGPLFKEVEVPEDKAVLYFYRKSSIVGSGLSHELYVNGEYITEITNGGYIPYMADPGQVNIVSTQTRGEFFRKTGLWSKAMEKVESHGNLGPGIIEVQPGAVYYFKCEGKVGTDLLLKRVPEEIGKREIQGLNLFPPVVDSQDYQTSGRGGDAPR